jgi:hypothetical protein
MLKKVLLCAALSVVGCGEGGGANDGAGGSSSSSGAGSGAHRPDPPTVDSPYKPGDCGLDEPAFCEDFEKPHPGGRGGEIDERRFAFSRYNEKRDAASSLGMRDGVVVHAWSNPDGPPTMCGELFEDIVPPHDVRVCQGQLNEVFNSTILPINSFMIRQLFDFTDRTGTIAFDVDAKRNDGWDGHGWWLEMWLTEDPEPIPYHGAPTIGSYPRNGIGFQIAPDLGSFDALAYNSVSRVVIVKDNRIVHDGFFDEIAPDEFGEASGSFRVKDTHLNRFQVKISKDHIEVSVSDYDTPDKLAWKARSSHIDLPFTKGYVHFQHVHYNASKTPNCDCDDGTGEDCGLTACWSDPPPDGPELCCWANPDGIYASPSQAYRWDNLGFDGPTYPMLRGYDAEDPVEDASYEADGMTYHAVSLGFQLHQAGESVTRRIEVFDVDPSDALWATFNFSYAAWPGLVLRYRFNGNAWHEFQVPDAFRQEEDEMEMQLLRAFSVAVPVEELVSGTNTLDVTDADTGTWIGNIDITIQPSR